MKVKRLNRVGYEIEVDRNTKRTMKSKETRLSFVLFFKKKKGKEGGKRPVNKSPSSSPLVLVCIFFGGGGGGGGFFLLFLKESAFFCFSFVSFVSSMIIPTVVHR